MTTTAASRAARAGTAPHRRPGQAGKPLWRRNHGDLRVALFFIAPALIGFVTFYVVPAVRGTYLSFTEYSCSW
jgi:multiple sugar transport system permease protein